MFNQQIWPRSPFSLNQVCESSFFLFFPNFNWHLPLAFPFPLLLLLLLPLHHLNSFYTNSTLIYFEGFFPKESFSQKSIASFSIWPNLVISTEFQKKKKKTCLQFDVLGKAEFGFLADRHLLIFFCAKKKKRKK